MTTGKTIALTRQIFVGKAMSLIFNMLSRLVITFLPRSKHLLISWVQSQSALRLEPKKVRSVTVSTVSTSICREVMEPDDMILVFWRLSFKPTLSLSSFISSRGSLVLLYFLPWGWCHMNIWDYWCFFWQPWFQFGLHPAQHFSWYTLHTLYSWYRSIYQLWCL